MQVKIEDEEEAGPHEKEAPPELVRLNEQQAEQLRYPPGCSVVCVIPSDTPSSPAELPKIRYDTVECAFLDFNTRKDVYKLSKSGLFVTEDKVYFDRGTSVWARVNGGFTPTVVLNVQIRSGEEAYYSVCEQSSDTTLHLFVESRFVHLRSPGRDAPGGDNSSGRASVGQGDGEKNVNEGKSPTDDSAGRAGHQPSGLEQRWIPPDRMLEQTDSASEESPSSFFPVRSTSSQHSPRTSVDLSLTVPRQSKSNKRKEDGLFGKYLEAGDVLSQAENKQRRPPKRLKSLETQHVMLPPQNLLPSSKIKAMFPKGKLAELATNHKCRLCLGGKDVERNPAIAARLYITLETSSQSQIGKVYREILTHLLSELDNVEMKRRIICWTRRANLSLESNRKRLVVDSTGEYFRDTDPHDSLPKWMSMLELPTGWPKDDMLSVIIGQKGRGIREVSGETGCTVAVLQKKSPCCIFIAGNTLKEVVECKARGEKRVDFAAEKLGLSR